MRPAAVAGTVSGVSRLPSLAERAGRGACPGLWNPAPDAGGDQQAPEAQKWVRLKPRGQPREIKELLKSRGILWGEAWTGCGEGK